jgi:phosphoadenosine phosphosulfate reductase
MTSSAYLEAHAARPLQRHLLMPMAEAVREAVEFIQIHEPPEGYFVGFSGGKDSICTLKLVEMAGVKYRAFYSCTGIDPPEIVRFIRENYPQVQFLFPKETFWQGIRKRNPPLRFQRWCCETLKHLEPEIHMPNKIMGIRQEESHARSNRGRINKKPKSTVYSPIFYWMEYHVWTLIEEQGLVYPSLYDEGWDRIGCVICPFLLHKNQRRIDIAKARWPGVFKVFEKVCREWWEQKKSMKDDNRHANFDEWLTGYYRGFE